jgi:hypothetical protein
MTAGRLLMRLVFVAATVTPVSACLFRVWVHQESLRLGYQLSTEERRGTELVQLEKQLELELAAERSPTHLVQLAKQLGLKPPSPTQVVGKNARALYGAPDKTEKPVKADTRGGRRG